MGDSFHRGDWLALAQSLVSIIAVVGAIGVVFLQRHFEKQRQAVEDAAKRSKARHLATWSVQKLYDTALELQNVSGKAYMINYEVSTLERLRDQRASIASLPIEDLDESHAIAVISARDLANLLIAIFDIGRVQMTPEQAMVEMPRQFGNVTKLIGMRLEELRGAACVEPR